MEGVTLISGGDVLQLLALYVGLAAIVFATKRVYLRDAKTAK